MEAKTESPNQDEMNQDSTRVDWDGPNDAENPKNWPETAKWLHIGVISAMTVVT